MASQQSFGHDNIQVLVKESQNVHIEISGTRVASLWVRHRLVDRGGGTPGLFESSPPKTISLIAAPFSEGGAPMI